MTADQIRSQQPEWSALLETFRAYMRRTSNFGHLVAYAWGLMADLKQKAHRTKRVDNLCRFSPLFREQPWQRATARHGTRGPIAWEVKMARVHLVVALPRPSRPTDRRYALNMARNVHTGEIKYFISNAAASVPLSDLLTAAFARWQIEPWFERAKQEAGLGAFEARTYRSLLRHWFCSRLAMYFLAAQTQRLRGGEISGSRCNRWPRRATPWRGPLGCARGGRQRRRLPVTDLLLLYSGLRAQVPPRRGARAAIPAPTRSAERRPTSCRLGPTGTCECRVS